MDSGWYHTPRTHTQMINSELLAPVVCIRHIVFFLFFFIGVYKANYKKYIIHNCTHEPCEYRMWRFFFSIICMYGADEMNKKKRHRIYIEHDRTLIQEMIIITAQFLFCSAVNDFIFILFLFDSVILVLYCAAIAVRHYAAW